MKQLAIGLNFHDAYVRSGLYKTLALPGIPGVEAAGEVLEVGADVELFKVGDRVGYVTAAYGAYATERVIAADKLIRLSPDIDFRTAAAVLVKGLTAGMLLSELRPLQAGDVCLVHAAAGGVGRILCQWASHIGARVIGTAGSEEKAAIARSNGCHDAIVYTKEDFASRVLDMTKGRGVDVVYDSVGASTFEGSISALAKRGVLVNFGQSSGPIPPFSPSRLAGKSNAVWRPMLFDYIEDPVRRQEMADRLFEALAQGVVNVDVGAEFPLLRVAEAHRVMEARATTGSTILIP
jgi:NADPH2:quinone reductase